MPRARGRVRRLAPRLGASARRRRASPRCSGCSPTTSTASSPGARSTRTCSTPTTRTSSTTSSCGGSTPSDFLVMPNASNTDRSSTRSARRPSSTVAGECEVDDVTADACGARGAGSRGARAPGRRSRPTRAAVPRFAVRAARVRRRPGWIAGTGYTGEDGVELHVPAAAARRGVARARSPPASRRRGSARATRCGSKPGCRCTATSSGPGSRRCRPGSAGWCAGTRATSAAGPPLEAEQRARRRAAGCAGCVVDGRQIPREGYPVLRDGEVVGVVTSGNFSPSSGTASRSRSCRPTSSTATRSTVDVRGRDGARHRRRSSRSSRR